MPGPWEWDTKSQRYRDTRTGRYLSPQQVLGLRDRYTETVMTRADGLTDRLVSSEITLRQWLLQARENVKAVYIDQYLLGRGGRRVMTPADWGRIGGMLRRQYQFLQRFADDIARGTMTPAQIRARFQLYFESSTQAFERAETRGRGVPNLPAYPGDGTTVCKARCRCHWQIEETEREWLATWSLGASEHCATCVTRAGEWNPLRLPKAA